MYNNLMEILILILKCLLVGVIWAALIIPAFFKRGGVIKYIVTVLIVAVLCYVLSYIVGGYAAVINQATLVGLIALVLSWILSNAAFRNESKVKSKLIAFTCVIAALSYLVSAFIGPVVNIL